ncbi:hypothetical protein Achl_4210 (plasmid) [Pseudarthrobacter chlorophenolicus A6]|uniref:Integral membrane protein n=1 Tax=Pseudarthrobacter chlorophenolicus (strain ATCC 700700 / DSM 12829 / CIP 107037 / JCM 12360 / KCTC 9906 / NCIMB 13794 / A6) TaxID=452863 RepID=B8HIB4_PSECP|nr:hypothetical protein [Pseudarthrobacter chlorophenolicus]ACL42161.1 hypothetical protein Achl_4210 [Pseudarthrobacter chlorophenolicus A6]SDQ14241.1 hypothetical protein SAMN04489738_0268 [Pseudarthrobacter chlorophenolicus]
MMQLLMAAALAVLACARIPVLRRNRKDTVFVAAVLACGAALLTDPDVYVAVDHAIGGINLARLIMQMLMVLGLWFLRSALLHAVAPGTRNTLLRRSPLLVALGLLVVFFLMVGPTHTTTTWGDEFEGEITGALFSVTGIAFISWVCGEIAVVCFSYLRRLRGTFRRGFTMVGTGCTVGCLTMAMMAYGVIAHALPGVDPLPWMTPDVYHGLELLSIADVGIGLTMTAVAGHRRRVRIARWEKEAFEMVQPIREHALRVAGLQRTLEADDEAPLQDRLHRMIVEIWDAELAAGGDSVLTPEWRAYLLEVERKLDMEHADLHRTS